LGSKLGGLRYAAVSAMINRFNRRLPQDPKLRILKTRIERILDNMSKVEMSPQ